MDVEFLTVYRSLLQVHRQFQCASAQQYECLIPDYPIRNASCLLEGDRTRTF